VNGMSRYPSEPRWVRDHDVRYGVDTDEGADHA
jgi:hypothetical protein